MNLPYIGNNYSKIKEIMGSKTSEEIGYLTNIFV